MPADSVISDGILSQAASYKWRQLSTYPSVPEGVTFEFNMNRARHLHNEVLAAADTLHACGAAVGLDHVASMTLA